jgi:hypothetical protein
MEIPAPHIGRSHITCTFLCGNKQGHTES